MDPGRRADARTRGAGASGPPAESWSIGIYRGDSPLVLRPVAATAALSPSDVGDRSAVGVADPFLARDRGGWHLFFEVIEASGRGSIGHAVSADGEAWRYRGIVLEEPFHLSYPQVFGWRGDWFMVPETLEPGAVRLYRATSFPGGWRHEETLVEGRFADPTPFRAAGRWWLFACSTPYRHETLRLYGAPRLSGPWREHPRSPVVARNPAIARPAGRVVEWRGRPLRFAQDCTGGYGTGVRLFEIEALSPTDYRERERPESPILWAGRHPWASAGMHHVDARPDGRGGWLACVDGYCR